MGAERIGRESGVRTVAARDGMRIRVGEEITVGMGKRKQKGLNDCLKAPFYALSSTYCPSGSMIEAGFQTHTKD